MKAIYESMNEMKKKNVQEIDIRFLVFLWKEEA